jgi:hypothetical protein
MGVCGDEPKGGFDFSDGAEAVASAVDKEGRGPERGEVAGAELVGPLRRVERIGEEEEAIDEAGLSGREICGEHGGHAATVGVSAEEDAAGGLAADEIDGGEKSLLVTFGAAEGRAVGTELAEREIAAKDGKAGGAEGFSEEDEERSIHIGASPVREDERVIAGRGGAMKNAADGGVGYGGVVDGDRLGVHRSPSMGRQHWEQGADPAHEADDTAGAIGQMVITYI